jgi:DNA-binding SARP family transcriptional activator
MRFQILGPLEISDGSGTVHLGGGKQRAVLALLLLRANEIVSTDALVEGLWGEAPPATAAKIVQNYVSQLRKALDRPGDVLVTHGSSGYSLRVGTDELDADRFERLFDEGRRALADGQPEEASRKLREALALWRGPPLSDFAFDSFAQTEIARLEERRLVALEERIEADLALGRAADLVAEIESLVAQHPLRERLRAELMLALYRSGRQAEALHVFQDARRKLVDELGVEPGPALQQLQRAILAHDPSLGPAGATRSGTASEPGQATPAGRLPSRVVLAAGAVLLAVAAGAAVLELIGGASRSELEVTGNSLAGVDPVTNRVVADVPVGRTPASVATGEGAVWTVNADDQTVSRYDPETRTVRSFGVGATPTAVAVGSGAVWVTTAGEGRRPT